MARIVCRIVYENRHKSGDVPSPAILEALAAGLTTPSRRRAARLWLAGDIDTETGPGRFTKAEALALVPMLPRGAPTHKPRAADAPARAPRAPKPAKAPKGVAVGLAALGLTPEQADAAAELAARRGVAAARAKHGEAPPEEVARIPKKLARVSIKSIKAGTAAIRAEAEADGLTPAGVVGRLKDFRAEAAAAGVPAAKLRKGAGAPDLANVLRDQGAASHAAKTETGEAVPPPWVDLDRFRARVARYKNYGDSLPEKLATSPTLSPEMAADFAVAFSARVGEIVSLMPVAVDEAKAGAAAAAGFGEFSEVAPAIVGRIQPRARAGAPETRGPGGDVAQFLRQIRAGAALWVVGATKEKGAPHVWRVASALPRRLAAEFLARWAELPEDTRRGAASDIGGYLRRLPDPEEGAGVKIVAAGGLRAVGANLYAEAAGAANDAAKDAARAKALRHVPARIRPGDHYARINRPAAAADEIPATDGGGLLDMVTTKRGARAVSRYIPKDAEG